MTTLIIITAYILSVFLARWINKTLYKKDTYRPILTFVWFIPVLGLVAFIIIYIFVTVDFRPKNNWFNGKYW